MSVSMPNRKRSTGTLIRTRFLASNIALPSPFWVHILFIIAFPLSEILAQLLEALFWRPNRSEQEALLPPFEIHMSFNIVCPLSEALGMLLLWKYKFSTHTTNYHRQNSRNN